MKEKKKDQGEGISFVHFAKDEKHKSNIGAAFVNLCGEFQNWEYL